ncbi:MAG: hypothetical protein HYY15_03715 [Candidatus Omnitrophica bacterium]|nr:hypothetical protein [Candidatus Omnitrophota bacterium]
MTRSGRAVVILLAAVAVLAIGVAGVAMMFQMKERDLRMAKERELLLVQSENQDLTQQLAQVKTAKAKAEQDLVKATSQLEQVVQQLAEERTAKDTLAKSVDDRQREIDRLTKDLDQVRTEKTTLSDQLAALKNQQQGLQEQLSKAQEAKEALAAKIEARAGSDEPTVELDKVVVANPSASAPFASSSSSSPAQAVSALQGQVLVVNREYDFIVFNLGKNQGLQIGQEFQVIRGQEVLGRVKVEKVYDELSAAALLPDAKEDSIREGDVVRPI